MPLPKADNDRSLAAECRGSNPDKVYLVSVTDTETVGMTFPFQAICFSPVTVIPPIFHCHYHVHTTLIRRTNGRKRRADKCSRNVSKRTGEVSKKKYFSLFLFIFPDCLHQNDKLTLSRFHPCLVTHVGSLTVFFMYLSSTISYI